MFENAQPILIHHCAEQRVKDKLLLQAYDLATTDLNVAIQRQRDQFFSRVAKKLTTLAQRETSYTSLACEKRYNILVNSTASPATALNRVQEAHSSPCPARVVTRAEMSQEALEEACTDRELDPFGTKDALLARLAAADEAMTADDMSQLLFERGYSALGSKVAMTERLIEADVDEAQSDSLFLANYKIAPRRQISVSSLQQALTPPSKKTMTPASQQSLKPSSKRPLEPVGTPVTAKKRAKVSNPRKKSEFDKLPAIKVEDRDTNYTLVPKAKPSSKQPSFGPGSTGFKLKFKTEMVENSDDEYM
jgi:hypothetical protein